MPKYITYTDNTGGTCEVAPAFANTIMDENNPRKQMSDEQIIALVIANDIPKDATNITVINPDA